MEISNSWPSWRWRGMAISLPILAGSSDANVARPMTQSKPQSPNMDTNSAIRGTTRLLGGFRLHKSRALFLPPLLPKCRVILRPSVEEIHAGGVVPIPLKGFGERDQREIPKLWSVIVKTLNQRRGASGILHPAQRVECPGSDLEISRSS